MVCAAGTPQPLVVMVGALKLMRSAANVPAGSVTAAGVTANGVEANAAVGAAWQPVAV